jgi:hypothetical protein
MPQSQVGLAGVLPRMLAVRPVGVVIIFGERKSAVRNVRDYLNGPGDVAGA